MVEEKPVAAFTLSLIGLVLQVVGAMVSVYGMFYGWGFGPGMMGPWMMMGGPWSAGFPWFPISASFIVVVIALSVMGVIQMNTAELSRVRTGSTLVLIASIIAFPTMFGFMLGSLLMFIGGIIGLTWQPVVAHTSGGA